MGEAAEARAQPPGAPPRGWARRLWTLTWKIGVFFVAWALLYAPFVLALAGGPGPEGGPLPPANRLGLELFGALTILAAAGGMWRFAHGRPFVSLGFRRGRIGRDTLVGALTGAGMIALALASVAALGGVGLTAPDGLSWGLLGVLAAAMALNTVTQEVMARGYLLQAVEEEFGVVAGVAASSVLFAALHAGAIVEGGPLAALNLLGAGVLLGLAFTTTRNLWLALSLHFWWNFLQGPVLGIAVSGQALGGGWRVVELRGPDLLSGGAFGLEGGLAATLATALGILALVLLYRREASR